MNNLKSILIQVIEGVEVTAAYAGGIQAGFDVIELPAAKYLMFQGEPFAAEDYSQAIEEVRSSIKNYDPPSWGIRGIRQILAYSSSRGYIELLAVQ